ncbi:MAG: hypothetical protein M1828_000978 [Chrysothrix sp. TS-e1954]|nr:MAG: hypothetical protein M1828_000978 [Chrysothrix sp. TS-e1954]
MPYTPPAKQSPASSRLDLPAYSRTISLTPSSPPRSPGPRPTLPRSASSTSYLNRARRSPSDEAESTCSLPSKQGVQGQDSQSKNGLSINNSIRTSPPPVSNEAIPRGAIVSPPDSTQNSSDDEVNAHGPADDTKLEELQRAVRKSLSFQQEPSPTGQDSNGSRVEEQKATSGPPWDLPERPNKLTPSARKISHSRSSTETSIFAPSGSVGNSTNGSDSSEDDDDLDNKPPLLRKKSGELVKPAIRPQAKRKVSSMPGTPTYSKAVHFNDNMEQVRHFLQVDRPIAVSAGGSPAELAEDEEFPFRPPRVQLADLELHLGNFPRESHERLTQPVRLERLCLSPDQKSLVGSCAVANLAFHKSVVARFTFDCWKTTSEVLAEYNNDTGFRGRIEGFDQFQFTIKLSDQANLEKKTMLLCVRYNVDGQEHWDNNHFANFRADFVSKQKVQLPQVDSSRLAAHPIPRSRHGSTAARPLSMSSLDDDFAANFDTTALQLKSGTARKPILPDTPPPKRVHQAGQPFGSRYDFGASLSAALSQAQTQLGDRSGIRPKQQTQQPARTVPHLNGSLEPPKSTVGKRLGLDLSTNANEGSPKAEKLMANKQSVDSQAYQDFISKFCFAGSKKPTQATAAPVQSSTNDGAHDERPPTTVNELSGHRSARAFDKLTGIRSPPYNPTPEGSGRSSPVPLPSHAPGPDSPAAFAYPYGQNAHNEFFAGHHTPIIQS